MNKATKGALAAGAAVVLLLGGAGSYALWSDEAPIAGGTISTGNLNLEPVGTGTWTDVSPVGPRTNPVVIADFNMVPGDVLAYDARFRVDAEGDNLQATIIPDQASITFPGNLISATEITVATSTRLPDGTAVPPLVTEDNDGQEIDVRVLVTFNPLTENQVGTNATINLANFRVVLQQTRS